jgi:hypothetical protein
MKRDNEGGQSLVETALALPLLLLMFLGMAELAQVCYGAINVSNAAKAAAQYAAQDSNTAVLTGNMLAAAQQEVGNVPGLVEPLDMPQPTAMPDGSTLPAVTSCSTAGDSYSCSYCSCSSPESGQAPFACGASDALTKCIGISHLEQNIIIQTRISLKPVVSVTGLPSTFSLYGHAVVKRLQ